MGDVFGDIADHDRRQSVTGKFALCLMESAIRAFEQAGHDRYQELCQQRNAGEGNKFSGDEGMSFTAYGTFCTLDQHLVTNAVYGTFETAEIGTMTVQLTIMAIRAFPGTSEEPVTSFLISILER